MNFTKSIIVQLLIFVVFALVMPSIIRASPCELAIAQTEQGVYIGEQITIEDINVNYWYGIPYAQQPVGNLRWMPPQDLAPSNFTNKANIPKACPQKPTFEVEYTESCLTLNVYSPANANNVPVYVWIHGGSFISGAGILYNFTQLVAASVQHSVPIVAVAINYRLGLLGFLADKELYDEHSALNNRSTTGNYGILDQMMALRWIKKNIRSFGGDPTQITVGGESAGGVSVTVLLTSPLVTNDTFQRAIVQSGAIWPNFAINLSSAIENSGSVLREIVKCATIQCLRNLTTDQILTVQDIIPSKISSAILFSPVIDGYVLLDTMEDSYVQGSFQKVPLLVGSNANETSLLTCPIFNGTANSTQVNEFLKSIYNATIVNEIPNVYNSVFDYDTPLTYLNIVYSDSWQHCGSRRLALHLSNYGLPTYFYTYTHILSITPPCIGAFHVAELLMLFPSLVSYLYPGYNLTSLEQQLSTNMMLYWLNFIRTANPNYDGRLATWDNYHVSFDNDFVLDINPKMRNFHYNFTCSHLWDRF